MVAESLLGCGACLQYADICRKQGILRKDTGWLEARTGLRIQRFCRGGSTPPSRTKANNDTALVINNSPLKIALQPTCGCNAEVFRGLLVFHPLTLLFHKTFSPDNLSPRLSIMACLQKTGETPYIPDGLWSFCFFSSGNLSTETGLSSLPEGEPPLAGLRGRNGRI